MIQKCAIKLCWYEFSSLNMPAVLALLLSCFNNGNLTILPTSCILGHCYTHFNILEHTTSFARYSLLSLREVQVHKSRNLRDTKHRMLREVMTEFWTEPSFSRLWVRDLQWQHLRRPGQRLPGLRIPRSVYDFCCGTLNLWALMQSWSCRIHAAWFCKFMT